MKIAIINENSQAPKNGIIEAALKKVVEPMGHEVVNYGMYSDASPRLTYVQCGILAAILLNSGAADFVITGCGTGEGAMLALNSFPGVICGHVEDPVDAYTFAHVNDGNAVAMPFAKGFGWGGELNLEYTFEKAIAVTQKFFSVREVADGAVSRLSLATIIRPDFAPRPVHYRWPYVVSAGIYDRRDDGKR